MAHRVPIDPDKGVDDLVRQLADDSKRLIGNELRLAKAEAAENARVAGRGVVWLGLAFGAAVVMLVALTLFLTTAIGRLVNGNYWVGALATAVVEIGLGVWLVKKGLTSFGGAPVALPETRAGIRLIRNG